MIDPKQPTFFLGGGLRLRGFGFRGLGFQV